MHCDHCPPTVKGHTDFTALGEAPSLGCLHPSKSREVNCTARTTSIIGADQNFLSEDRDRDNKSHGEKKNERETTMV